MTRIWLYLGVTLLVFGACVPNKKVVFYQKDDLKHRKEIPRDTVLRSHPLNIREYRIQPLDILSINFETLSEEDDVFDFISKLSTNNNRSSGGGGSSSSMVALNGVLVNTSGDVEYAVLGPIHVQGLTIFQAQDTIKKVAAKYIPDVVVRVRMLNFRFTVLGEINGGEKTVISTNTRLTMSEAMGLCGGLTELADRSLIKVIRQKGAETEIYYIDLLKEEFIESPHYYVQQNDVIIVPPLKQRPFRKYFVSNLAVISSAISFIALIISVSNR
jgi:polysaccharide export outer membrane protein